MANSADTNGPRTRDGDGRVGVPAAAERNAAARNVPQDEATATDARPQPNASPARPHPPFRQTFFRLLGFLRPYRWGLAASVVLAIGSQAAGLAIPWLTGKVIDDALPGADRAMLRTLVAAVAVIGLVKAVLLVARRLIAGRQALEVEGDL